MKDTLNCTDFECTDLLCEFPSYSCMFAFPELYVHVYILSAEAASQQLCGSVRGIS